MYQSSIGGHVGSHDLRHFRRERQSRTSGRRHSWDHGRRGNGDGTNGRLANPGGAVGQLVDLATTKPRVRESLSESYNSNLELIQWT
jgi:hypothetical protein